MTADQSRRLHGDHEDERSRAAREKRIHTRAVADDHAAMRDRVEGVARDLYIASGGDEREFPWPCKGAGHYRHLAHAALRSLGVET